VHRPRRHGPEKDVHRVPGYSVAYRKMGESYTLEAIPGQTWSRNQTSYDMTVTSTASSGRGLPDFGVFQNQKVFTVYLEMRASDDDTAPSWTLQSALLQPTPDPSSGVSNQIHGVPTPPYATLKQVPELTPELATVCARKLIAISGILTADGKLEQISMKKTPDPQVSSVVTDALSNWTSQPAQIDGKPVALKIMIGIRLVSR
jgi:hypothetical protein